MRCVAASNAVVYFVVVEKLLFTFGSWIIPLSLKLGFLGQQAWINLGLKRKEQSQEKDSFNINLNAQ